MPSTAANNACAAEAARFGLRELPKLIRARRARIESVAALAGFTQRAHTRA
jgi:hypothetical protein